MHVQILGCFLFLVTSSLSFSQNNSVIVEKQTKKADKIKTGWNIGALPFVTYSTDLGLEVGGLINLFDYGKDSIYPRYHHSLYFEISHYTKGSGLFRFSYDSESLIKNINTIFDVTYHTDQAYDFLGFNGYKSVYNANWTNNASDDYKSRMFYKYDRHYFRITANFEGHFPIKNIKWVLGLSSIYYNIASVDIGRLNSNLEENEKLPTVDEQPGLYETYIAWNIIPERERNGGYLTLLKTGLSYDSRNFPKNPTKGIFFEMVVDNSFSFLGSEESFGKISFTQRQYFGFLRKRCILAYRLGYQQTLWGNTPFYYQNDISTTSLLAATNEGLGGIRYCRGIKRNMIVGDGIFYGTLELRIRLIDFRFIKQNFYLATNPFFDFGMVTKDIDIDDHIAVITEPDIDSYFSGEKESLHMSWGVGAKVVMNENFIVSCDYGIAFNKQDGNSGVYIGLNYLF